MRIGLIRHFAVEQPFLKGTVKQSAVLQWFEAYNRAPLVQTTVSNPFDWERCYASELPRAIKTAALVFEGTIETTSLLNEPFPSPLFLRDIRLPFPLWGLLLRSAIVWNHRSQQDRRAVLEKKIHRFLDQVLQEEKDTLVVSHAFTMEILSRHLRKAGFRGPQLAQPANGVLYVYERK